MNNQIPKNWQKVKLGEIAVVNMGQSPSSKFYNTDEEGLPFYQGVADFGEKYPTPNLYCSQPAKTAEPGTALFSVRAPVGDVNMATEESCIGRGVASIEMNNGNNDYLYFLLKNQKAYFKAIAGGTTYESINKNQIEDTEFTVPKSQGEQKRIVFILSAFDGKIEVNNKIARTLEKMAQTIFKEWFVKFRFPGYGKVEFIDSEMGKIPKGWEVKKLGQIMEFVYGKGLKEKDRKEGDVLVIGSSGIIGQHSKKLVSGPGIVVGRKGVVGSIIWVDEDFYPIDTTFYIKSNLDIHFVYFLLLRQRFITGDSAVPGLNRNQAYLNKIILPSEDMRETFVSMVTSMFKKRNLLNKENQKLAATRDLLLPRLMRGEVRA